MVPRFGLNTYSETFSEISAVSIEKGKYYLLYFQLKNHDLLNRFGQARERIKKSFSSLEESPVSVS